MVIENKLYCTDGKQICDLGYLMNIDVSMTQKKPDPCVKPTNKGLSGSKFMESPAGDQNRKDMKRPLDVHH